MTATKKSQESSLAIRSGRRTAVKWVGIASLAFTAAASAQGPSAATVSQAVAIDAALSAATNAQLSGAAKPSAVTHALSPIGLFLNADPAVKAVLVAIGLASVVTLTILLVKSLSLMLAKLRMQFSFATFQSVTTLAEAGGQVQRGVGPLLLAEAEEEIAFSHGLPSNGIRERVFIALGRTEPMVGKRIASGTGILATIGLCGIVGSFVGIANPNTAFLSVVAPGIAEALLATSFGLVAAIPAVVIYNAFARSVTGNRAVVGNAVALTIPLNFSRR